MKNISNIAEMIRKYFTAFEAKNWEVIKEITSDDLIFTTQHDDHINKQEFLAKCLSHGVKMKSFKIEKIISEGDEAYVTYLAEVDNGNSFRNTEFFVMENGKIKTIDVYFGL
jgi:ketosteroid isomerase-like protein